MSWEIVDGDFDEHWNALESPYRRKIAALANAGKTSDDPHESALILALARRRLQPLELWGPAVAAVIVFMAIAQLFLGGAEALTVALVIGGVAVFALIRRGRLEAAVAKNEEIVANAPPPPTDSVEEPEGDAPNPVE